MYRPPAEAPGRLGQPPCRGSRKAPARGNAFSDLGVPADEIDVDHERMGTTPARPGHQVSVVATAGPRNCTHPRGFAAYLDNGGTNSATALRV